MPLYDYKCHQCGQTFEVRQRFADPVLTVHEGCGGSLERLIFPPALQFKGTGWYVTDYGKGGKTSPSNGSNGKHESGTKAEGKSESKSEAKSESKPESRSESKAESKPSPATSSSDR